MKLEIIDEGWRAFNDAHGVKIDLLEYTPHATKNIPFEVTEEQIKHIEKLYAQDYEKFGYERQMSRWI